MLLAINANNTNVKFGLFEGERMVGDWRIRTESSRTSDEYMVWLSQLLALAGIDRALIKETIIATVVPQALFHLRMFCERHLNAPPLVIGEPGVELGIRVLMDKPNEVGADRLANAVGGHLLYPGPLIIVDFGTATSFDITDAEGNFIGGAIAPGINLSLEALHMATAKLPRIALEAPSRVIGKDTLGAMQSGVYLGLCRADRGAGVTDRQGVRRPLHHHRHRRAGAALRRRHARHRPSRAGDHHEGAGGDS